MITLFVCGLAGIITGCSYIIKAKCKLILRPTGDFISSNLFPQLWRDIAKGALIFIPFISILLFAERYISITRPINEIVVLITNFEGKGRGSKIEISRRLFDKLISEINDVNIDNISVIWIPHSIKDNNQMKSLAKSYRSSEVTIVISGWADEIGVKSYVNVFPVKKKKAFDVEIDEFEIENLNINEFCFYFRENLPKKLTFIVAFINALSFSYNKDHVRAHANYLVAKKNLPKQKDSTYALFFAQLGTHYLLLDAIEYADSAIIAFKEAILLDPKSAIAYNNLGSLYLELKRVDDAIAILSYGMIETNDPKIAFNLGNAYVISGEENLAEEAYLKAISLDKGYVDPRNNLAILYYCNGELNKAIREWETCVEINSNFSQPHYNLGNAYYKEGMLDDALREHRAAVRTDPENYDAYNSLSIIYLELNKARLSIKMAKRALSIKPDYDKPHYNLGLAYHSISQYKKAMAEYQIAIELNPYFARAHLWLADLYINQGEYEKAQKELNAILKIPMDKYKDEKHILIGVISDAHIMKMKITKLTLLDLIEKDPGNAYFHLQLAGIYRLLGDVENAEKEYLQAAKYEPNNGDTHLIIAFFYLNLDKKKQAIQHYKRSLQCPKIVDDQDYDKNTIKYIMKLDSLLSSNY